MKLSLAFVALTAAADSQAPVISLNLADVYHQVNANIDHSGGYLNNSTKGGGNGSAMYAHRYTAGHPIKDGDHKDESPSMESAGAQNSFADECEVPQNTEHYHQFKDHCQEPVASAYDHHDGDISGSITTAYTLFVKSAVRENPVKADTTGDFSCGGTTTTHFSEGNGGNCGVNTKMRGEWVITYDVQDDAGNSAEQVQFALIMIDTKKPDFTNSPATLAEESKCSGTIDNCDNGKYIHRTSDNDGATEQTKAAIAIELCGADNGGTQYYIEPNGAALAAEDQYDEDLDQSNSRMSFKIQTVQTSSGVAQRDLLGESMQNYTQYSFGNNEGFTVPEKFFVKANHKFEPRTLSYRLDSADFADIFGQGNANNVQTEYGTVTIDDTIKPTITGWNETEAEADRLKWECGYPAFNYRTAFKKDQYNDCFDDTVPADETHGSAKITIHCAESTGFIDQVETFHHETVANQGNPSEHQRKCLGLGTSNRGAYANYADATGIGRGNQSRSYYGGDESHIGTHSSWNSVTLTYELEDSFGNVADEKTRTVTITDNIAPTLYITQKQIRTVGYLGNPYTGGNASNTCDGAKCKCDHRAKVEHANGDVTSAHCVQNHHVDANGKEYTTYDHNSLSTAYGQTHFDANEDNIADSNAYSNELEIQHSAGYAQDYKYVQELMEEGNGYGCYDICSSTTTTVQWQTSCTNTSTGSEFNMLKPGTYYLKYECKDLQGNSATACRTFVNVDKTRPVITVLQAANENDGTWHVEASRDNNYVDAGATCSDMVDGNISQDVEVSGDVVNMAAVGTYKINYNCEDSAGQTAVQATRTVVVQDKTCPTCTIPGGSEQEQITVEASFPYTEEPSTCTDTLDGAMPNAVIYGHVDVELTGTYVLTYSVTDKNGNGNGNDCLPASGDRNLTIASDHFTKTVVVEDTMIPIISLKYRGTDLVGMMAEQSTTTVNGWVIGAVASAVSGVALLGYAATRKATVATSVPV